MPFASKAHRTKLQQLVQAGLVTAEQYAAIEKGTAEDQFLPERVPSDEADPGPQKTKRTVSPFW